MGRPRIPLDEQFSRPLSMRFTPDQMTELDTLTSSTGSSRSDLVRRAVDQFIDDSRKANTT